MTMKTERAVLAEDRILRLSAEDVRHLEDALEQDPVASPSLTALISSVRAAQRWPADPL